MGKAQGGGSGWVLLTWSARTGRLLNQWAADHTLTVANGEVLLALDMYEHAYHMDFGAKAGDYVNAYMGALDWTAADKAFAQRHAG
jgi:Fe-Mn family superoxide dismutase